VRSFRAGLEIDPGDAQLHRFLAVTHQNIAVYRQEQGLDPAPGYESALRHFGEAIRLDPQDAHGYRESGAARRSYGLYLQSQNGDSEPYLRSSLQDLNRAVELDPSDAKAFFGRGVTSIHLAEQGKDPGEARRLREEAGSDLRRASEINPDLLAEAERWRRRLGDATPE